MPAPRESRVQRTKRVAQRVWPVALGAWKRWDSLTPQQKEHYRKLAADYTQRGRKALASRSEQRRRRSR
jgi:hypothetical protein